MIGFRCIPMDTASAIRFRHTGRDDAGNALHRKIAEHPAPCRHCLAESQTGALMLLGSYHFGRPHGVYWTPSPIFLHAEPCERFEQAEIVASRIRSTTLSTVRVTFQAGQNGAVSGRQRRQGRNPASSAAAEGKKHTFLDSRFLTERGGNRRPLYGLP